MNDELSLPRTRRLVLRNGEFVPADLFPVSAAVMRMAMEISAPSATRPANKRLAYTAPTRKPVSTPAPRPTPTTKFVAQVRQPTKSRRDVNGSSWSLAPVQHRREQTFAEIYGTRRDALKNRALKLDSRVIDLVTLPGETMKDALIRTIAGIRTLKVLMDLERYVKSCETAAKKLVRKPINRFAHK